jgi:hypothetical protein
MMEEWRLICSARQAEMQLINAYKRNHELHEVLKSSISETAELREDIAAKLHVLTNHINYLKNIDPLWV